MQSRSFAVLGLVVILCTTCGGCGVEYQATVECSDCNGATATATNDQWYCDPDTAEEDAKKKCGKPNIDSVVLERSFYLLFVDDECALFPPPDDLSKVIREAAQLTGFARDEEVFAAADEPACPLHPDKVDMKVTGFYEGANAGQEVPRKFTVKYTKKLATGNEEVVLSAMVPLGGQHEFICTDAEVTEVAGAGYVSSLRASFSYEAGLETCGQATVAVIPWDSSSVELHHNDNGNPDLNRCELIIIPPAGLAATAKDAAPATDREKLNPSPDPAFSQSDR